VYLSAVWSALSPPEAPNVRPFLAPLNCHTSILHMLAPFYTTETGGYANESNQSV
jgi:hypothetical protein